MLDDLLLALSRRNLESFLETLSLCDSCLDLGLQQRQSLVLPRSCCLGGGNSLLGASDSGLGGFSQGLLFSTFLLKALDDFKQLSLGVIGRGEALGAEQRRQGLNSGPAVFEALSLLAQRLQHHCLLVGQPRAVCLQFSQLVLQISQFLKCGLQLFTCTEREISLVRKSHEGSTEIDNN